MNKKGFTLVELIVSFGLISIMSIFLFQIISIISNMYINKGIKTELITQSSNISNYINKDIYINKTDSNEIKQISVISSTEIVIVYSNNVTRTLIVDNDNKEITYDGFSQKFANNVNIADIIVDYDYVTGSSLIYDGVLTIKIPITYEGISDNFDVFVLYRFNSSNITIRR